MPDELQFRLNQIAFEQACSGLGMPLEPGETPAHWAFRYANKRDAERWPGFATITRERDGRWGAWFGPRPPYRVFDSEAEAKAYVSSASQSPDPANSSTTQTKEADAEEDSLP